MQNLGKKVDSLPIFRSCLFVAHGLRALRQGDGKDVISVVLIVRLIALLLASAIVFLIN